MISSLVPGVRAMRMRSAASSALSASSLILAATLLSNTLCATAGTQEKPGGGESLLSQPANNLYLSLVANRKLTKGESELVRVPRNLSRHDANGFAEKTQTVGT